MVFFFFFQAEDGIRDVAVTGVQTCALPISWKPKHTWETRSAASRFAAALWLGLVQDGFGKFAKVARVALKETRTTALLQRNREEHNRLVAEFNRILETYRLGLEAITPLRRFTEPELVELVYRALNPADRQLPKEIGRASCRERV